MFSLSLAGLAARCHGAGGGGEEILSQGVTLSSADLLALHTTPITVVAAQGTGTAILPRWLTVKYNFGTTPYAIGGDRWDPELRFAGVGTLTVDGIIAVTAFVFLDGTEESRAYLDLLDFGNTNVLDCANKDVILAQGSPYIDGDGSLDLTVWYQVLEIA
jgi:hypothetical protein